MFKDSIQQDLKTALLAGDKFKVEVLRGLKSAILYEEVAKNARESGLDDGSIATILSREAKRRAETANLYQNAGEHERAAKELAEKAIIESYLPKQLSDEELAKHVDMIVASLGKDVSIGQIISAVRQQVGASADGTRIAEAVKSNLHK